jgi:hypothetical protein
MLIQVGEGEEGEMEQTAIQVNYSIQTMERAVCATFSFGENAVNSPYLSIYFLVNNSGIVAVYDKSLPVGNPDSNGQVPVRDELKTLTIAIKRGSQKYEVLRYIYDELVRIGEKLKRDGRSLTDSDIEKLITKISRKYEDPNPAIV